MEHYVREAGCDRNIFTLGSLTRWAEETLSTRLSRAAVARVGDREPHARGEVPRLERADHADRERLLRYPAGGRFSGSDYREGPVEARRLAVVEERRRFTAGPGTTFHSTRCPIADAYRPTVESLASISPASMRATAD